MPTAGDSSIQCASKSTPPQPLSPARSSTSLVVTASPPPKNSEGKKNKPEKKGKAKQEVTCCWNCRKLQGPSTSVISHTHNCQTPQRSTTLKWNMSYLGFRFVSKNWSSPKRLFNDNLSWSAPWFSFGMVFFVCTSLTFLSIWNTSPCLRSSISINAWLDAAICLYFNGHLWFPRQVFSIWISNIWR